MKKFTKRILAVTLSASMIFGSIEISDLLNHKFMAATVNDKSLDDFMDEVSTLYEENDLSSMVPDVTFSKESQDTVIVDDTVMVPVEVLTDNTDILYSDIEEDIVEHDNEQLVAVEDVAKNTDYEIIKNNDSIVLSKTYQSKTLIVKSPVQIDTYNAENVISGYGNLYILKYATEEDTKYAYDKFLKNKNIDSVEIDSLISAETLESLIEETTEESVEEITETSTEETTEESSEDITTESSENTTINEEENTEMLSETETSEELSSESSEEFSSESTTEGTTTEQETETITIPDGVVVAILDSGIDKSNSLFGGRIVDLGINLSTSGDGIQDDNGHGTAVASVVAKNSDAYIMPIKIANSEGKGTVLSLYLAIQAAIENDADIINVSLTTASSDLLTSIVGEAAEKGIAVVAAAGNQSANVENYAPANIEDVIAVSATDKDYSPASYSNYGSMIDYAALGEMEVEDLNGTATMTGTSLAAAYVSAVMAYCMENGAELSDFVYPVEGYSEYYGQGVISFEEIKVPEKEQTDVEGFDFKIKQSFIEEGDRDNYKLQLLTNEDVEYTFDGGQTWQKANYIEINRNEEFYDDEAYMSSIRTLGIKASDGSTVFKDFAVIDCNNPKDPASQEINLEAETIPSTTSTSGSGAYYDPNNSSSTQDTYRFSWNIGATGTTSSNTSNTATITSFTINNSNRNCSVPSTVKISYNGTTYILQVTAIGDGTSKIHFFPLDPSGTITIPTSVTTINAHAFDGCSSATKLTFTSTSKVKTIGDYAFKGCSSIVTIDIPDSVTTIGKCAFYGCSKLTTTTLGTSVSSIETDAFDGGTPIGALTIQSSISSGGNSVFKGKTKITSVNVKSTTGALYANMFQGCTGITTLSISSNNNAGISVIPEYCFYGCSNLKKVALPSGIWNGIGNYAFYGCTKLTQVTIDVGSDYNFNIGDYAFYNCTSLSSIALQKDCIRKIGDYAFYNCNALTEINLGKNITSLGASAFENCSSLTKVHFKGAITQTVGTKAFFNCTSLTGGGLYFEATTTTNTLKNIGDYAFNFSGNIPSKQSADTKPNIETLSATASWVDYAAGTAKVSISQKINNISGNDYADYIFILDLSDSLNTTKKTEVKNCVKTAVNKLYEKNSKNRIMILAFWDECYKYWDYQAEGTTLDKAGLLAKIDALKTSNDGREKISISDGNSDAIGAVLCAISEVQKDGSNNNTYIMLGTDAAVNVTEKEATANIRRHYIDGIFCVGIGLSKETAVFSNLADATCYTKASEFETDMNTFFDSCIEDTSVIAINDTFKSTLNTTYWDIDSDNNSWSDSLTKTTSPTAAIEKVRSGNIYTYDYYVKIKDAYHYTGQTYPVANASTSFTIYGGINNGKTESRTADYCSLDTIAAFTIYFNDNGGSGGPVSVTITGTGDIPSAKPTRTGYTFRGWGISRSWCTKRINYVGTGTASDGTTATMTKSAWGASDYASALGLSNIGSSVTVYAQWESSTSTLKVNPNDGTWNGSTSTQSFTQNYNTTKDIPAPTRTGYTFTGWDMSQVTNGTLTEAHSHTVIESGVEMSIAQYAAKRGITNYGVYDYDSFDWGPDDVRYPINSGCIIAYYKAPDSNYYKFVVDCGLEEGGNKYIFGASSGITDTITAQWSINTSTLKVNPNGGTWNGSTSTQSFTQNYNTTKDIPAPTRTGYTFTGWDMSQVTNGTLTEAHSHTVIESGVEMSIAQYAAKRGITNYGVYDYDSFDWGPDDVRYPINSGCIIAYYKAPDSNYYKFVVDCGLEEGGNKYIFGASSGITDTITAQWSINTSTLKVNPNGGTWNGSTSTQSFTQNYNTTKAIPVPTRTGYTFTGWTKQGGNGTLSSLSTTEAVTYTYGATDGVTDIITANWELILTDIPVNINWVDKNNEYASRPNEVTLRLMNGTKLVREVLAVTGDNASPATTNTWSYTFTDVQKYDTTTGEEIQYTVVEGKYNSKGIFVADAVTSLNGSLSYKAPDYSGDNSGFTITNIIDNPIGPTTDSEDYGITISGSVTWKDNNDKYHFRPNSVTIELYQNGKLYNTVVLNDGATEYKITGLPMIDENLEQYTYTIKEKDIDNYVISYLHNSKVTTSQDDYGNVITMTTYIEDIINTFVPGSETQRFGNNVLTMRADYEGDFDALQLDEKSQQVSITLKQLNLMWRDVDSSNGIFEEEYIGYSGNELSLMLIGTKTTLMENVPYGKYEIVVEHDNNFELINIEELDSENAVFSYEDGKYYVTYSYEYTNTREDLQATINLDEQRGYIEKSSILNFFKPNR